MNDLSYSSRIKRTYDVYYSIIFSCITQLLEVISYIVAIYLDKYNKL